MQQTAYMGPAHALHHMMLQMAANAAVCAKTALSRAQHAGSHVGGSRCRADVLQPAFCFDFCSAGGRGPPRCLCRLRCCAVGDRGRFGGLLLPPRPGGILLPALPPCGLHGPPACFRVGSQQAKAALTSRLRLGRQGVQQAARCQGRMQSAVQQTCDGKAAAFLCRSHCTRWQRKGGRVPLSHSPAPAALSWSAPPAASHWDTRSGATFSSSSQLSGYRSESLHLRTPRTTGCGNPKRCFCISHSSASSGCGPLSGSFDPQMMQMNREEPSASIRFGRSHLRLAHQHTTEAVWNRANLKDETHAHKRSQVLPGDRQEQRSP